jgi:hypothetical protein
LRVYEISLQTNTGNTIEFTALSKIKFPNETLIHMYGFNLHYDVKIGIVGPILRCSHFGKTFLDINDQR